MMAAANPCNLSSSRIELSNCARSASPDSSLTGAGIGSLGGDVAHANKNPINKNPNRIGINFLLSFMAIRMFPIVFRLGAGLQIHGDDLKFGQI